MSNNSYTTRVTVQVTEHYDKTSIVNHMVFGETGDSACNLCEALGKCRPVL